MHGNVFEYYVFNVYEYIRIDRNEYFEELDQPYNKNYTTVLDSRY